MVGPLGFRRSVTFQRRKEQTDPVAPQHFLGAGLGTVPSRRASFQELASDCRGLDWRAALIAVVRHLLDPAVLEHHRQIARERRGIDRQQPAQFDATHRAGLGHRN